MGVGKRDMTVKLSEETPAHTGRGHGYVATI
jgi:hypothetical protein